MNYRPVQCELLAVPDRPDVEERALLEAIASGDRSAYERLFRRYHAKLHAFVCRRVGDAQLADEIASDTLLTVWTDAKRFRGQSTISTWIFGIAYRTSLQALRRRGRRLQYQTSNPGMDEFADLNDSDDPERHLSDEWHLARLGSAIDQLSDDHQAVVRLTALGHSCAEIAALVDCPPNTVKTRMFHARRRLKELLGSETTPSHVEVQSHDS